MVGEVSDLILGGTESQIVEAATRKPLQLAQKESL
jgi:hypothetical protein